MREQLFTDICERLRANVAAGQPDLAPGVLEVSAESYQDEVQFQRELNEFFLQQPLLVALTCDVPAPGDYVTLTIVDHPLLIVRGNDEQVRVFLNVCRHRGAKVAQALVVTHGVLSAPIIPGPTVSTAALSACRTLSSLLTAVLTASWSCPVQFVRVLYSPA